MEDYIKDKYKILYKKSIQKIVERVCIKYYIKSVHEILYKECT